jgi:hypothetical protein
MSFRDQFDFEPLRIRAWLRTPVVGDQYMPLDGVLLYQAHRYQAGGFCPYTIPGAYTTQGVSTIPVAIEHPGRRNWYYRASWAQWGPHTDGRDHWNKRFDMKHLRFADLGRKSKITTKSGEFKQYHMPIFYRSALWVEWYLMADKEEMKYLLCTVTHLGKKRSQGWGRVSRWQIDEWPEDWSVWRSDGRLMRGIPMEDAPQDKPLDFKIYGIRPSYWRDNNQMPLVMPDA